MEYVAACDRNCFKWPAAEKILNYEEDNILCQIAPPIPINPRSYFTMPASDFDKANFILNSILLRRK
jgi:hypothetical protein